MTDFQNKYVRRMTAPFNCSLITLMHVVLGVPRMSATIFVSHAWKYNNTRFLSCLSEMDTKEDDYLWIDTISVSQTTNDFGFK